MKEREYESLQEQTVEQNQIIEKLRAKYLEARAEVE